MEDDNDLERELFEQMQKQIFGESVQEDSSASKVKYIIKGKYKMKKHALRIKLKIKQDD